MPHPSMPEYPTFKDNQLLIVFFTFSKVVSIYNPSTYTIKTFRESYSHYVKSIYPVQGITPSTNGGAVVSSTGGWTIGAVSPAYTGQISPTPAMPTPICELETFKVDPRFAPELTKSIFNGEYVLCESLEHAIETLQDSNLPGAKDLAKLLIENAI